MLLEKNSWNRIVQFPLELVWWKNRDFLYFNLLWSSLLQKNSWKRVWQFALKLISRENSFRSNSRFWVICASCLCLNLKNSLTEKKKIRQSNSFEIYIAKTIFTRNFCQTNFRENFRTSVICEFKTWKFKVSKNAIVNISALNFGFLATRILLSRIL